MNTIKYNIPLIVKSGDWWNDSDSDVLPATPQVAQKAAEDFNADDLTKYSDLPYLKGLLAEASGDKLIVTAEVSGKVTETKTRAIRSYLSGQCSDGWGEGFEQQEFGGYALGYAGYNKVFISTWDRDREPEVVSG
jgi:hypothetical protein